MINSEITVYRAVTKISSRQLTRSRQGIKDLLISFGAIFLYFPMKVTRGHVYSSQGKSPVPDL